MSKEKQIRDLTKIVQSQRYVNNDPCIFDCEKCGKCLSYKIAEALYNAGYRKQSEVAREIFAVTDILGTYNPAMYDELKKKYAGANDEKQS